LFHISSICNIHSRCLPAASPSASQAPNLPDVGAHRRASRHAKHHIPAGHEPSVAEAIIATSGTEDAQYYDLNVNLSESASCGDTASIGGDSVSSKTSRIDGVKSCFGKYGGLMVAMLMCQVGMILFNLGLTYGFAGGWGWC
jgi:hypothetical protein